MGRKRLSDFDLPTRLYERRGAYYFDHPRSGKWLPLGRDLEAALAAYAPLAIENGIHFVPPSMAGELFRRARSSAKQRGIPFLMTESYVEHLLRLAGRRCSVSGAPLTVTRDDRWSRNPWAPSIDRIDSKLPYQEGNCRVVCHAANVALNEWGIDVLRVLASGILDIQNSEQKTIKRRAA